MKGDFDQYGGSCPDSCRGCSNCNQLYLNICPHCYDRSLSPNDIRNNVIDECIKQLGGRYGAAATKDLQVLKK